MPQTKTPPTPTTRRQAKAAPAATPLHPGAGMPAKTPAAGRARPGRATTPQDATDEASLALPHERDQSTDMTEAAPDPQVQQASTDLKLKLQDTGTSAAMDSTYQKLKRN